MSEETKSRQHETVIEIAAPAEEVWKALAEAEGIQKWFAPEARVESGVGGSIWLSWGPGMEGSARIEIWDPGRRLQTVDERDKPYGCSGPATDAVRGEMRRIAVDYILEAKGGTTVLRLVHSGFGLTADWDGEYDSTRRGWPVFLRILKHCLERHRGEACRQIYIFASTSMPIPEAWARLLEAAGSPQVGGRYRLRNNGDELTGVVETMGEVSFNGSVDNLNDCLMWALCDPGPGGGSMLSLNLALFGVREEGAAALQGRWTAYLERLYPKAATA
jgi:uncharacterized protein YndB with AHSA1/START domain